MQPVRLIFRNHLLPPIVIPFDTVHNYVKVMEPGHVDELKYAQPDEKKRLSDRFKRQMTEYNELVGKQVNEWERWVDPLKKCPWYYGEVEKFVQEKRSTKKWGKYSFEYLIRQMSAQHKRTCWNRFKKDYSEFKKNQNYKGLLNQIVYVPPFWLEGPEDIANLSGKQYKQVSENDRTNYEIHFNQKLEAHYKELTKAAQQGNVSRSQLMQLLHKQFLPAESSALTYYLFK